MTWPVVEVEREDAFPQRTTKIRVNGMELGVYSITVTRVVGEPPRVTIELPAEYIEVTP